MFNPMFWVHLVIGLVKDIGQMVYKHVEHSLRLQLVLVFAVCFFLALVSATASRPFFENASKHPVIEYRSGVKLIDSRSLSILNNIQRELDPDHDGRYNEGVFPSPGAPIPVLPDNMSAPANPLRLGGSADERITHIIEQERWGSLKILIADLDGKVLYKSAGASESQIDLHGVIRNAMNYRLENYMYENKEYVSFYPLNIGTTRTYLIVSGLPQPNIEYRTSRSALPNLLGTIVFIASFFLLTKRKMRYIEELASGLMEISRGNLHYRVSRRGNDELGSLAGSINEMTAELQHTIEEERVAQKTKTELITNVSHDLRTPLTLIMGYLRLLKDKNFESEQQASEYLNIAFSKSEKLKTLIDDLFEYTKLAHKGEFLSTEKVCLNELMEQLIEEHVTHAEQNELTIKRILPEEKLFVRLDPDKMIRVFDNLITNAVKYSITPGIIKIVVFKDKGHALICISNQGSPIPQAELERLFERFYRVDASRSSETGGSGLGLAIAKSIVDFHGGQIWAECEGEEIRFYVKLKLDASL